MKPAEFEELENLSEEGRKLVNTMKICLKNNVDERPTLESVAFKELDGLEVWMQSEEPNDYRNRKATRISRSC